MKLSNALALAALLTITGACSKGGADSSTNGTATSYTINGQNPDQYFEGFIAKQVAQCPGDFPKRFLTANSMLVGKNSNGQDIRANIAIYMHEDHSYVANFEEDDVIQYFDTGPGNTGYNYKDIRKHQVNGTWQVVDDHLVLSDLAIGKAISVNNQADVELQFTNDLITAGLKGQIFTAENARSDFNEKGEIICK